MNYESSCSSLPPRKQFPSLRFFKYHIPQTNPMKTLNFLAPALLLAAACIPCVAAPADDPAPVVRLTAPPQLDGNLADWPFPALLKMSSAAGKAEMRLGYDDAFFYATVSVADMSPWKNNPAREEEAIKGGDAVAFYFQTRNGDEQRVLVAPGKGGPRIYAFREHSAQKRPYTFASPVGSVVFEYVGPMDGAKAAVKTHPEGYVLEIAIPWKSLGLEPAPRSFKFDAQVIFSDPAGTLNVGAAWWHASEGPGLTIEDLPTEARLYPDTWGHAALVDKAPAPTAPGVTAAANSKPGENILRINLPRAGKLSVLITDKEGAILRELVSAKKFEAGPQQIAWDGRDRYGEPLPLGNYQWKALLFDGMGVKFMGSVGNSGRPPYRTPDGLGSLGGQHGSSKALAADQGGIYMAGAMQEGMPAMRKIEAQTGKALWMRSAGAFQSVIAIGAGEELACVINAGGKHTEYACDITRIDPKTGKDEPMGSAKARRSLATPKVEKSVAGVAIAGGKAWFSVPTEDRIGSVDLRTGDDGPTYQVPSPTGLVRLDETHLLVCSGSEIVAMDLKDGQKRPVAKAAQPRAVAVGPDGKIYVSEMDASQQIKVFTAAGQPLATWGRAGGKPAWMPKYDPLAFRNITGAVVGLDGNLWLAEDDQTPNRFVKLSPAGTWMEDFYGPVAYNTFGPDLDDFSTVYYNSGGNNRNPFLIETKIDYAKYQADPNNPAAAWSIRTIYDLGLAADGVTRNDVMSTVASIGYGHLFAFKAANGKRYLFRPSKNNRASAPVGAGLWVWEKERWIPCAFLSGDEKQPSWKDANGDGLVQPEETYATTPVQRYAWIDRDLTLHGEEGKLAPANPNAPSTPDYQGGKFTPYLDAATHQSLGGTVFVSRETDGAVFFLSNSGPHRHLSFWDRATENRLSKVAGGRVQWIAGTHTPNPTDTEFSTASGIAGVVDGIVLAHNIEPANYPAFTTDGFALGNAMVGEDGTRPNVGPNVICIENFTGLFVKDPQTGKPVLFAVSSGDDRILEVTGPGKTTRFEGSIALSQVTGHDETPVIPYETAIGNTPQCIAIDGEETEWKSDLPALSLTRDGQVVGDVRLRRDAGALYLFASVLDPAALEKGGGIQVTLARQADGPATVIQLQAARDKAGKWTGKATLLKAGQPGDATKLHVAATERWRGLGYRIEAEIPLELLSEFSAPKSQTFRRLDTNKKNARNGKPEVGSITEVRLDLTAPLFLNVQLTDGAKPGGSEKRTAVKVP